MTKRVAERTTTKADCRRGTPSPGGGSREFFIARKRVRPCPDRKVVVAHHRPHPVARRLVIETAIISTAHTGDGAADTGTILRGQNQTCFKEFPAFTRSTWTRVPGYPGSRRRQRFTASASIRGSERSNRKVT